MIITINNHFSYIIEAQISGDHTMGVRILQYLLNEGQRNIWTNGPVTHIRLPDARVIYWETTGTTPDRETIIFEFPDGALQRLEVPSFKFPEYSPARLKELNLGILLPFCVLNLRKDIRAAARQGGDWGDLGERLEDLLKETVKAAEQSEEQGMMSRGDMLNVVHLIRRLRDELYGEYTGLAKEKEMWEDIDVIDYDGMLLEAEKIAEKKMEERLIQEREKTTQKLREMGVSEEQLAGAGLVETAR
jgi:hypothetical protein